MSDISDLEAVDAYFDYDVGLQSYLSAVADKIVYRLRENGFTKEEQPDRQAIALGEEVGEFLQQWRRWRGWARQPGTEMRAAEELADVIITGYVTAAEQEWDIDTIIRTKLEVIFTRGWRSDANR